MSPLATSSKLNPSTLESLINHQCKQFIWTTIMLVHHNISPLWHRNTSVILILFFLLLPYFHCLLLSILSLTLHWYFKYLSSLILTIFFWKNCTSQYTSSHHKQFSSPEELLDQLVPSWPQSTRPFLPLSSFLPSEGNYYISYQLSSLIFALDHKLTGLVCEVFWKARRKGLDQGSLHILPSAACLRAHPQLLQSALNTFSCQCPLSASRGWSEFVNIPNTYVIADWTVMT